MDKLDHHVEDREELYGYSDHPTRQITVLYQGDQREEYAANTLLHELMHAAADVVGFHPENEEEAVHALTAGLMLFLRDSRNAPLVKQLTTQGACGAEPATDEPVGPEPESGAQGRIGWLRLHPDDEYLYLMREVPGGWAASDRGDDPFWPAKTYPDAEFTPIRTLADDEVAVKRDDLREVLGYVLPRHAPACERLRDKMEAGEGRG